MGRFATPGFILVFGSALQAQSLNVRGIIFRAAGQPVTKAVVGLVKQGLKDITGADGAYAQLNGCQSMDIAGRLKPTDNSGMNPACADYEGCGADSRTRRCAQLKRNPGG